MEDIVKEAERNMQKNYEGTCKTKKGKRNS